ncbi:MmcB family DNA repair protein [Achromobacter aloeverae]
MKWTHNGLAEDLAAHLRQRSGRVVWTDMQLGPSGSPRPDVYSVEPSFTKFCPMAYEVKVSVADYRRDVTSGKWQTYLPFAAAVTFAVPAGLIEKAALPEGCGLMVRGPEGWRTAKAPTLQAIQTLPHAAWIKLMIDGIWREAERRVAAASPGLRNEWILRRQAGQKLGLQVAELLEDRNRAETLFAMRTEQLREAEAGVSERLREIEKQARDRAEQQAELIDGVRAKLAAALGLPASASILAIRGAAEVQAARLDRDAEIQRLQVALRQVERALQDALQSVALARPQEVL